MRAEKLLHALIGAVFAISLHAAYADTYSYTFDVLVHGTNASPPPWGKVSFTDVSGGVQMDLNLSFLGPLTRDDAPYDVFLFFNISSSLAGLTFLNNGGDVAGGITVSGNSLQMDGDGKFDVRFQWATQPDGSRSTFNQSSNYLISGTGLSAASFNSTSVSAHGGYFAGQQMGNINDGGNTVTVVAIPEPETYAMILSGLGLMGFVARRRRNEVAA